MSKTCEKLFVQSSIFLDNYVGICGRPFFDVLHELVNWMRDHEQGVTYWDDVVSDNLFPEFRNAEREQW